MPRGSGRGSGEFADPLPFFEEPDGQRRRRAKKKKHEVAHKGSGRLRRSRPEGDVDWDDDELENADWRLIDAADDDDDESDYSDGLDDEDADWYGDEPDNDDEEADWHSHDDR